MPSADLAFSKCAFLFLVLDIVLTSLLIYVAFCGGIGGGGGGSGSAGGGNAVVANTAAFAQCSYIRIVVCIQFGMPCL